VHIKPPMRSRVLWLLLSVATPLAAQEASPYVPLQHWAMPYVEHLIATGVLTDPTPLTRPLRRADLVLALQAADTFDVSDASYAMVRRLLREFKPRLHGPQYRVAVDAGVSAATYAVRDPLEQGRGRPATPYPYGPSRVFENVGADLELLFGPGIAVTHPYEDRRLRFDQDWYDTRKNGLRTAEAYLDGQWRYAEVFFGALDKNWGPSGVQGLLLSDNPYNLDHFAFAVGPPRVQLQAIVTELDPGVDSTGATVNRYMMEHRLYLHPHGRWTFSIWEGTEWPGVGRQPEPWFLNALNLGLIVRGYQGIGNAKSFVGSDVERHGAVTLFGQFLLGDIHINRGTPEELKPVSYGLTAGAKGGFGGNAWTLFYTQVANFTYREFDTLRTPLFHSLGLGRNFDDYDQATAKLGILTRPGVLFEPEITVLRQGEGDPRLPYPPVASWPATPVIFQGVVERTVRLALGGRWEGPRLGFVANAGVHFVHNASHITGASATHFVGSVALTFRLHSEGALP
jgi:hypothetical protein